MALDQTRPPIEPELLSQSFRTRSSPTKYPIQGEASWVLQNRSADQDAYHKRRQIRSVQGAGATVRATPPCSRRNPFRCLRGCQRRLYHTLSPPLHCLTYSLYNAHGSLCACHWTNEPLHSASPPTSSKSYASTSASSWTRTPRTTQHGRRTRLQNWPSKFLRTAMTCYALRV